MQLIQTSSPKCAARAATGALTAKLSEMQITAKPNKEESKTALHLEWGQSRRGGSCCLAFHKK
jgi:hypothetical protein